MKKRLNISFYINKNKGSEYEVGYKYASLQTRIYGRATVLCPIEEINEMGLNVKVLRNFYAAQLNGMTFVAHRKAPPQIGNLHRVNYLIWVVCVQFYILFLRKSRAYHFVTPVQAYSPIWIHCFRDSVLGPMSVFPTWLAFTKNVPFFVRLKSMASLVLANTLLPVKMSCRDKCKYLFIHKSAVPNNRMDAVIIPSLFFDVDQIEKASIGNKKNIIFSGRDIAVKNVSLHEVVFDILSKRLPEYNFILISDRYEKVTSVRRNLLFYPVLHKVEYYKMLECTILNVFISFEMGGISSLEACMYGAPTVSLEKNGIYEYLSPSAEFTVAIDQLDKPYVIAKMIEKIIINKWYTVEIENQKSSLNLYSSDNVLNKLMDIYK